MNPIKHIARAAARYETVLLTVYRAWSATRPLRCRYSPTCSAYAVEALQTHRFLAANRLIIKRLVRCQPWGGWGFDPVPVTAHQGHHDK